MPEQLSNPELRRLRAAAQRLKPMLKVGKAGVSPQFLKTLEGVMQHHELIKIKFDEFKDERKALAELLAGQTGSHLILQVGHVAVLYRRKPEVAPS
jgi:RNA-binding protein